MARHTTLDKVEFQRRAHEVFLFAEGEEPTDLHVFNKYCDGTLTNQTVYLSVEVHYGYANYITDFKLDMSMRPTALAYLLGERDDFVD